MMKISNKIRQLLFSWLMAIVLSACHSSATEELDLKAAAVARMKLGLAYLAQADESDANLKLAYINLKKANDYDPDNLNIMLGMAMFDQRTGEYKEAEMIYRHIIAKQPYNGLFRLHYAVFLCARQQYQAATQQFQYVINLDRHEWKADSLEQYGYCAIQNEDKKNADHAFSQLFSYDAKRKENVKKTAMLYQSKKQTKIASYLLSISKK